MTLRAKAMTLKDSVKKVLSMWDTPWFLGGVLISAGTLGLLRQVLRLIFMIPIEVWISIMLITLGVMVIGLEAMKQMCANQQFHTLPRELMRRSMQMGQRLSILAYDVAETREEVKIVLQGVSPLLAEVICASSALEAICAVANEIRRLMGYVDEVETQDKLATAVGWLQRPQLMLGYEDQLRCNALAQQATKGDAPPEGERAGLSESWEMCRGMAKAEASERLLQELAEKDPSFRKVVPPTVPEAQDLPLNDFAQVLCELLEFRLPSDLDERAQRLKRRAFWSSLITVFLWRHYVRRKPLTIARAVTTMSLSTVSAYLALLHVGLPASIYARLPLWLRDLKQRLPLPGAPGRLLRYLLQLLLPPLRRPLMLTAAQ